VLPELLEVNRQGPSRRRACRSWLILGEIIDVVEACDLYLVRQAPLGLLDAPRFRLLQLLASISLISLHFKIVEPVLSARSLPLD